MTSENTSETSETVTDPKKALIQKGVILASAAVGLLIAVGVKLPKTRFDNEDPIEVGGDSDDETVTES